MCERGRAWRGKGGEGEGDGVGEGKGGQVRWRCGAGECFGAGCSVRILAYSCSFMICICIYVYMSCFEDNPASTESPPSDLPPFPHSSSAELHHRKHPVVSAAPIPQSPIPHSCRPAVALPCPAWSTTSLIIAAQPTLCSHLFPPILSEQLSDEAKRAHSNTPLRFCFSHSSIVRCWCVGLPSRLFQCAAFVFSHDFLVPLHFRLYLMR